jgi:hypothetical protein
MELGESEESWGMLKLKCLKKSGKIFQTPKMNRNEYTIW